MSISTADFKSLVFRYVNKSLSRMLGYNDSEVTNGSTRTILKGKSINLIMPKIIQMFHDEFIKRLFIRGSNKVLGKDRVVFIKDIKGLVKPVRIKMEFSYDQKFGYAFVGTFELINKLSVDNVSKLGLQTSDAMIFLVDEYFNINEIT